MRACSGTSFDKSSTDAPFSSASNGIVIQYERTLQLFIYNKKNEIDIEPCGLKLNRGGKGRPLGRRAFGSRSSSKNE